jgi:hypothetical protein
MKKLLLTGLISVMCFCGCSSTTMNVNVEGEITNAQSNGFIKICDKRFY